jgi:4-hydroxy-tetrahydrodipicolinate synthase
MKCPFRGSYVALPTPFRDGEPDLEALSEIVEFHAEHKTDGLVVCGTSGEAVTLSDDERRTVIEHVIAQSHGLLPVIAGTGTNDTRHSLELTRFAEKAGADGVLCVTPYYNKPSPLGLERHFGALAEATALPLVLYNVPSRTGCDLKPATAAAIRAGHGNVVAIKEASGSMGRARELRESSDLALIAGEDALIADFMAIGAVGVIGVVANIAPAEVAELCRAAAPGGDAARTAELCAFLSPLVRDLFVETNPVPLKAALALMGLCRDEVRLPLAPLLAPSRERLEATLLDAGLGTLRAPLPVR